LPPDSSPASEGVSRVHGELFERLFMPEHNNNEILQTLISAVSEIKKANKEARKEAREAAKPRIDLKSEAEKYILDHPILFIPHIGFHSYSNGVYSRIDNEYVLQAIGDQLADQSKPSTRGAILSELQIHEKVLIPQGVEPNQNRRVLNLKNGMYDLDTDTLTPHSPTNISTIQLPVTYDPSVTCPRWLQFLDEIQPESESRGILQEISGLALIGDTRYEKSFWLYGAGGNGKGTYLNTISAMLGDQNISSEELQTLNEPFHAINLFGKLVNISTEVVSGDISETTLFKKIISGDMISDSYKMQDRINFRPFCLMLFSLNELPTIYDNTDAFFDRISIIKFPVNFRQDPRHDENLLAKLKSELDGIFIWALAGLKRLEATRTFTRSPNTLKEVSEYRQTNDKVACFIADRYTVSDENTDGTQPCVGRSELFADFKTYCKINEFRCTSSRKFLSNLKRLHPSLEFDSTMSSHNGSYDRFIFGISLNIHTSASSSQYSPDYQQD